MGERVCESVRYARRKPCTEDGPKWDVVTYTRPRGEWREYERHAACFIHGITEVENFATIEGSTRCELKEAGK